MCARSDIRLVQLAKKRLPVPRTRGDEPLVFVSKQYVHTRSPHTRASSAAEREPAASEKAGDSATVARAVATTYLAPAPTEPWYGPKFSSLGQNSWSKKENSAMLDGRVLALIAGQSVKHTLS